uniref:Uncharacterized protein n=1 Tax=Megaselia scalaris TaxID=36166 RepID=T1GBX0_MEGSC
MGIQNVFSCCDKISAQRPVLSHMFPSEDVDILRSGIKLVLANAAEDAMFLYARLRKLIPRHNLSYLLFVDYNFCQRLRTSFLFVISSPDLS